MRKRAPELERGVQGGWCRERKAAGTDTGAMRADAKDGRAGGVPLIAVPRRSKEEGSRRSKGEGNRWSKEEGNRRSKEEGSQEGRRGGNKWKSGKPGVENGTERGSQPFRYQYFFLRSVWKA